MDGYSEGTHQSEIKTKTGKTPSTAKNKKRTRRCAVAVCLFCVLVLLLPNVSASYAQRMGEIPVVGNLIRVFTVRNYSYSDQNHELDLEVPNLSDPQKSEGADRVNREVDELTAELAEQFYAQLREEKNQGHGALYVDYDVLTNRETWFTLRLAINSINASASRSYKVYNIDRSTGKLVKLCDLFCSPDFGERIKEDIIEQMKQKMQDDQGLIYFTDGDAGTWEIANDQNFYLNEQGELVILLDQYKAAPGFMGALEFTIRSKAIDGILKPQYQNIAA